MKLANLAKDYMKRAEVRLRSASACYSNKDYPDVVRYSQEAVELSLKACLRAVGIEYPKEHDVSKVLNATSERFPEWFRREIPMLCDISFDLSSKRAPSLYGLEVIGKAPSEIFNEPDAREAFSNAKRVFRIAEKFLKEIKIL
ncbi:MAG: HEPN domain-containing protein [Candidatus Bathyarchaeia archaeon]